MTYWSFNNAGRKTAFQAPGAKARDGTTSTVFSKSDGIVNFLKNYIPADMKDQKSSRP
jgi:ribosomal protein L27